MIKIEEITAKVAKPRENAVMPAIFDTNVYVCRHRLDGTEAICFSLSATVNFNGGLFKIKTNMADEFEVSSLNSSEIDSPIPSVVERLGQLRPSKELLEYYRRKLVEYDGEQEQLVSKLEEYKSTYEEQVFFLSS